MIADTDYGIGRVDLHRRWVGLEGCSRSCISSRHKRGSLGFLHGVHRWLDGSGFHQWPCTWRCWHWPALVPWSFLSWPPLPRGCSQHWDWGASGSSTSWGRSHWFLWSWNPLCHLQVLNVDGDCFGNDVLGHINIELLPGVKQVGLNHLLNGLGREIDLLLDKIRIKLGRGSAMKDWKKGKRNMSQM